MATKTPKTYTISLDEIRAFVEKQPKDDSYVGECGSATRCMVARAIQAKYHPHTVLVADSRHMLLSFQSWNQDKEEKWHQVEAGEDATDIDELIRKFDRFGGLVYKAQALTLFEKVAA